MSIIQLHSGRVIDILAPMRDAIDIEDIAHALSNLCRWSGQCDGFYSVAQHSVIVSEIVPPEHALEGLLHDGTEAFLVDLPSPLKALLPDYKSIEERLARVIASRFGLPATPTRCVKVADTLVAATERRDLFANARGDGWSPIPGLELLPTKIEPLAPLAARCLFLARWIELHSSVRTATPSPTLQ